MAKIDMVELQVKSAGILQIIRDGHYLALCTDKLDVLVLRNADGSYPCAQDYNIHTCQVYEGRKADVENVANWIDNLIGGRPVAGHGMRQTVQVEVVRATPENA